LPPNPLILSLDTSAAHCAVALVCGDKTLASLTEEMTKGQAERLMPMMQQILAAGGKTWTDLDKIAVCTGPGNFTGVRIAVSAARGLALALDIPAIGVSVFEALAYGKTGNLRITLDGRRGQVFWQDFCDGKPKGEAEMVSSDIVPLVPSGQVDPVAVAKFAAKKETDTPPAPLYLRPADAALPSDPPPKILL